MRGEGRGEVILLKRKGLSVAALLVFCLTASFFGILPISGESARDYDPWFDVNDDGKIDMRDIAEVARRFGSEGDPINKTEVFIQIQEELDSLNESVSAVNNSVVMVNETMNARMPIHGCISVPASAFVSCENWQPVMTYEELWSIDVQSYFVGSVQLPDGVTVKSVTIYWYDIMKFEVLCRLLRYNQTHKEEMAYLESEGGTGYGMSCDTTIQYATVDNIKYAYQFFVALPPSPTAGDYRLQYAVIEYEYPA